MKKVNKMMTYPFLLNLTWTKLYFTLKNISNINLNVIDLSRASRI